MELCVYIFVALENKFSAQQAVTKQTAFVLTLT